MEIRTRDQAPRNPRGAGHGRAPRPVAALALGLVILVDGGCRSPGLAPPPTTPIRVTDAADRGDPARRASVRLVVEGLDADAMRAWRSAEGSYQRAIQVDPTNPYVYLALARHHLDAGDPARAQNLIDQAAALFEAESMVSPQVQVHLIGLRGWALEGRGLPEDASLYLDRAARLAPQVWGDGYLSAAELR